MDVIQSARRTIRHYGLAPARSRVLIALSGGADSVALTTVMRELAESEHFELAGVAHLNHRLRGSESDADEAFCRRLSANFGMPIFVDTDEVAARARRSGVSVEHAGHQARLAFFERAAALANASAVAVAHTRDDQAETFLLRLLRGAGPRGLSGMHPRSGLVVRPFLETPRAAVRTFVASRRLEFREDASNGDVTIPRNRVRHELVPLLGARFSPGIVDALAREATIAGEDADALDALAAVAAGRLISETSRGLALSIEELMCEPPAVSRRVIRLGQQRVAGECFIGFDAVDAVLRFAVSKSSGPLDLPGHRVNRSAGNIVLTTKRSRDSSIRLEGFQYQLQVPGRIAIPEARCAISADVQPVPLGRHASEVWTLVGRSSEAVFGAESLAVPLSVRNRRAGDKIQPLGLKGHKKLQDVFVDAKTDREERDRTPIVVDAEGRIVWVPGHALAEDFKVTGATRAVVVLKRVPS